MIELRKNDDTKFILNKSSLLEHTYTFKFMLKYPPYKILGPLCV